MGHISTVLHGKPQSLGITVSKRQEEIHEPQRIMDKEEVLRRLVSSQIMGK